MYQVSVFVHVLAAIVWVGGMLFLAVVAVPATRGLPPAERGALFGVLGRRFRAVGWICIALLVVTGPFNLHYRGVGWETVASGRLLESDFGRVLAAKLVVVGVMLLLSIAHDFVLGPASTRALVRTEPVAARRAAARRRRTSWLARVNVLLAVVVVALAVALVRGLPW